MEESRYQTLMTDKPTFPPDGVCFVCKGCGQPAFYFPTGVPGELPPGTVAHSKPLHAVRQSVLEPSRVTCKLYHDLSPQAFWLANKDQPRIENPTGFRPMPMS